jgi:hypothetical protein
VGLAVCEAINNQKAPRQFAKPAIDRLPRPEVDRQHPPAATGANGLAASFFIAIFLVKYRNEYILALPAFAMLFAFYMSISLEPYSIAQRPEWLFRHKRLMVVAGMTAALLLVPVIPITPGWGSRRP